MASGGKRGGADRVLESRHLVGLFLGVVLLCGVFFTLGYVMGRTQYGGSVHAETLTRKPLTSANADTSEEPAPDNSSADAPPPASNSTSAAKPSSAAPPTEWDFYANKKSDANANPAASAKLAPETTAPLDQDPAPEESRAPAVVPAKSSAGSTPRIAKGSIILQVAALRHQSDALAMADLLQQKRFPSFVAAPAAGDALYRVQVGPYSTEQAADAAKAALDHDGFNAIIKH